MQNSTTETRLKFTNAVNLQSGSINVGTSGVLALYGGLTGAGTINAYGYVYIHGSNPTFTGFWNIHGGKIDVDSNHWLGTGKMNLFYSGRGCRQDSLRHPRDHGRPDPGQPDHR